MSARRRARRIAPRGRRRARARGRRARDRAPRRPARRARDRPDRPHLRRGAGRAARRPLPRDRRRLRGARRRGAHPGGSTGATDPVAKSRNSSRSVTPGAALRTRGTPRRSSPRPRVDAAVRDAVGVRDEPHLGHPELLGHQAQRALDVVGHLRARVAQHHRVAAREAEVGQRVDARVHAGHDREPPRRLARQVRGVGPGAGAAADGAACGSASGGSVVRPKGAQLPDMPGTLPAHERHARARARAAVDRRAVAGGVERPAAAQAGPAVAAVAAARPAGHAARHRAADVARAQAARAARSAGRRARPSRRGGRRSPGRRPGPPRRRRRRAGSRRRARRAPGRRAGPAGRARGPAGRRAAARPRRARPGCRRWGTSITAGTVPLNTVGSPATGMRRAIGASHRRPAKSSFTRSAAHGPPASPSTVSATTSRGATEPGASIVAAPAGAATARRRSGGRRARYQR